MSAIAGIASPGKKELVNRMLELNSSDTRTPQEREAVQREMDATDRQIDQLVYQLYDLSDEEIAIIEQKG